MLTFKEFLTAPTQVTEGTLISKKWKITPVEVKAAIKYLNDNCKDGLLAIANDGVLYRGFSSAPGKSNKMLIMNSSKSERTSRDTNNIYQLMFDTSESMSDVPSRSNSFICSSKKDSAGETSWQNLYAMVPVNGTTVAVSNVDDIFSLSLPTEWVWDETTGIENFCLYFDDFFKCFVEPKNGKYTDAEALNKAMAEFTPEQLTVILDLAIGNVDIELKNATDKEYDDFEKINSKFPSMGLSYPGAVNKISYFAKKFIATGEFWSHEGQSENFLKIIRTNPSKPFTAISNFIANKKKMKITTVPYGTKLPYDSECWFSGKCVAIPIPLFDQILSQLHKQKVKIGKMTFNNAEIYDDDEDDEDEDADAWKYK